RLADLAQLRQSQELFRKVFEEGPIGMSIGSMEHQFTQVNRAFCNMLGYSEKELTRLSFVDVTHPDDIKYNERLGALQNIVLDITRRQDLPRLLNAIVERAAHLLSASAGGLYLCDPEREEVHCVVSYNTPKDYTGIVLKYGEGAAGLIAKNGKPLIVDNYRTWSGRAKVYESDNPFTALLSVPLIWQDHVIGILHVEDIESRRFNEADLELMQLLADHAAIAIENERRSVNLESLIAERTSNLAESEQKYRSLLENIPDITWTADEKGRNVFFSTNVLRITGYTAQEICQSGDALWRDRVHPDDRERAKEAFNSLFLTEKTYDVEY